jgi:pimeloyl-ACP methyl ester carboxylesterase/DNA-binding CsgD family transcriptional regulator
MEALMRRPPPSHPDDPGPGREIRFCEAAPGVRVAYATVGHGPALLVPPGWIGHLELLWRDPAVRAFYAPLAAGRTVVCYDKPGCGLSDDWPGASTLESDLLVLAAVVDHLKLEQIDLLGMSVGAPVSLAFAARWPARVRRLVVYGGYADGRLIASAPVRAAMLDLVRAHWGLGSDVLADIFLPDGSTTMKAQFAELQRGAASTEVACQLLAQCYEVRVDDLLDRIDTPTLVLHREADRAIPYRLGRDLAVRIAGARLVSLAGRSHFPHAGDAASVLGPILEFLGATAPEPMPAGSAQSPSGLGSSPLTARQSQVASLVAEGRTNRQIAEQLGIEERSAEGHVERIRQRLGVSSRVQVAAWWIRQSRSAEVPK